MTLLLRWMCRLKSPPCSPRRVFSPRVQTTLIESAWHGGLVTWHRVSWWRCVLVRRVRTVSVQGNGNVAGGLGLGLRGGVGV